ncbi:MAG: penicillin-binding protein [bacterium]|nr:penicillin-binding protein [Candidatus Microgenomates bacterium CPR3]MCQ3944816.1 penicillin-binding protein [bacterium]RIK51668.1 MAG: penicillin-binding protein [Candidatus Microgenomates bacterium]
MKRQQIRNLLSLAKVLEYIGKPIFFLFTISLIFVLTTHQLIKNTIHNTLLKFKSLSKSKNKKQKKFTFRLRFPILSTPKLKLPKLRPLFIIGLVTGFLIIGGFYYFILKDLPSPSVLKSNPPALSTKILDRNGILLYQIYKDENRSLITINSLPKHVIEATLAAEDKNFYHHPGIDPVGIARALTNNVSCAFNLQLCTSSLQGGSTITQQLIKNTLLSTERTITRKLKEIVLALRTEQIYSKDEILEMYLNQVPYGGTAYGIEEASKEYLGKSIKDVNLAEAAFLTGLPVSPTTLSPYGTTPYLAKIRQHQVLERMVELGMISENDKIKATETPLNLNASSNQILAPHFVMYVRSLLATQFGETLLSRGGLTVTTSLDLSIQNKLQQEVNKELDSLKSLNVNNGAGLIVSPKTGEILAMVGSRNFFDTKHDGQVNLTLAERQPGSSIKPLTYALAFMRGLSPSSTIDDSPICFRQPGSPDYCPKNYDGNFHGKVTLKTALGSSYNIPAIKLLNSLGVDNLVELARSMGITTWDDPTRFGLALTLGGGEVTMFDLSQAYSVFANNGVLKPLNPILKIQDANGQSLKLKEVKPSAQVIPETVAFQINQILSDNNARSPAFGYNSVLNIKNKTVAVKTGTTNNLRDNWTIGYTPEYLVSTWVGNNDNSPMSRVVSGITGASPIWSRTMQSLLSGKEDQPFAKPDAIVRARASCDSKHYDYFIRGQEPRLNCENPETGKIL